MILPPFDAEDDPANVDRGHRTVAGLLSEERELWLEVTDRELEHKPAEWWHGAGNPRYAGGPPFYDPHDARWYVTARNGSHVRWARVLMMDKLGRDLLPTEHVHHINEDAADDRIENLELLGIREHGAHHGREAWKARKAAWPYEWSAEHPCCVSCGTTERKHEAHGLCSRCDSRERARRYRAARKAA